MMSSALLGSGGLLCLAMLALRCLPMEIGMLHRWLRHDPPTAPISAAPDGQTFRALLDPADHPAFLIRSSDEHH
jgi:hypothetical protein